MNEAQRDELSALEAVYPDEMKTVNKLHHSYSIQLEESGHSLTLSFEFHPGYPALLPPRFQLESFRLDEVSKAELRNELIGIFEKETEVLFLWVEHIKEFLSRLPPILSLSPTRTREDSSKSKVCSESIRVEQLSVTDTRTHTEIEIFHKESLLDRESRTPETEIFHGESIVDRRSVFQAHLCRVTSVDEVGRMLDTLKQNKKIAQATHNILAYRFQPPHKSVWVQDCDDDREHGAGGRLLHLLQFSGAEGVAVVVTRWYGGIQLGPDRFKHINNVARTLLVNCDVIKGAEKDSKKKKK